jgi:YgiT-type zinc finger domain-containing protein
VIDLAHRFGKCSFCGGAVKEKRVTVDFRWGDDLIIIKDVPAGVCEQCGEKYFTAEVSKVLEKLATSKEKPTSQISVPIMKFRKVA